MLLPLAGLIAAWIFDWPSRRKIARNAATVFGGGAPTEPVVDVKTLHAKIGVLALENDFLEHALSKAGLLSAKR